MLPSRSWRAASRDEPTSVLLDDERETPHTTASRLRHIGLDWWSWEILGITLSLSSSVALIVLSHKYNSQPMPRWRHGITLNAIISTLTTTAKASLLLAVAEAISQYKWLWFRSTQRDLKDIAIFDDASRGPYGAITMLLKIHIRDFASVGALITILSLAFDPFMQQVVVYTVRPVSKGEAAIGRAQTYHQDYPGSSDYYGINLPMRAAFYNGLFNGNAAPQLAPVCPTGNCTWQPMSPLAVCSKCEDITSTSPVSCDLAFPAAPYTQNATGNCSWTFAQNLFYPFQWDVVLGAWDPYRQTEYNTTLPALSVSPMYGLESDPSLYPYWPAGIRRPLSSFARVLYSESLDAGLRIQNVTACAFFPCVKTYKISVTEGSLDSHQLLSWYNLSDSYLTDGDIILSPPETAVSNTTENTTFSINSLAALGLANILGWGSFDGSANQSSYQSGSSERTTLFSSNVMQALYEAEDLGPLMETVAVSLTDYIRNISSTPQYGTVWGEETYVHIRWLWLILPMTLAPISLFFLLSAIWISSHRNVKVWKSSILATILHGLENPIGPDIAINRPSEMGEVAKRMRVRLTRTSDASHNLMLTGSQVSMQELNALNRTS